MTSPWCGAETKGGTRNLGGGPVQPRRLGRGIRRPVGEPRWYRVGFTGGWRLARVSGSPYGPAHPMGLSLPPFPSPCTPRVLHRCITGLGIELLDMGATEASAVPGRAYGSWGTVG